MCPRVARQVIVAALIIGSSSTLAARAAEVAVVDTGDGTEDYVSRIQFVGYPCDVIPKRSGLDVLDDYALVVLPVGHARPTSYTVMDSLAADYKAYVAGGGGLWVAQPNPFGMPANTAEITWVPYALTLYYAYVANECPPVIVDDTHCITTGLPDAIFSPPTDEVTDKGDEWQVVVEGASSGRPSVLFAEYGSGKVLVELGHPTSELLCPFDNDAVRRYVECTRGSAVPTRTTSWSAIKARFH